jgi:hypothetical protein
MKQCSKAISTATGKPESYIGTFIWLPWLKYHATKHRWVLPFLFMTVLTPFSHFVCTNNIYYVGVSITDNASVIFGGSDEPCALGNLYSIGSIAMESNGMIQAAVTDLLEPFGLNESRMYINFFDMPRANVGWSRRTFAGWAFLIIQYWSSL